MIGNFYMQTNTKLLFIFEKKSYLKKKKRSTFYYQRLKTVGTERHRTREKFNFRKKKRSTSAKIKKTDSFCSPYTVDDTDLFIRKCFQQRKKKFSQRAP